MRRPTVGTEIGFREDRQRQRRAGERIRLGGHVGPTGPVLLRRHAHHQEARAHRSALRPEVSHRRKQVNSAVNHIIAI